MTPSLLPSSAAISVLLRPLATRRSTCSSLGLSGSGSAVAAKARSTGARSMRSVSSGRSAVEPPTTSRNACTSVSGLIAFSRKPRAPARTASSKAAVSSKVVSSTTGIFSARAASARISPIPSSRGIRMSDRITSGCSRASSSSASAPSDASPTRRMSSCSASRPFSPSRTSCWSSTSSSLIVLSLMSSPCWMAQSRFRRAAGSSVRSGIRGDAAAPASSRPVRPCVPACP